MSGTWKLKFWLLLIAVIVAIYMLIPTFMGAKEKRLAFEKQGTDLPWYYNVLPKEELNLGLDLRGGLYMEMDVGIEDALRHQVDSLAAEINRSILSEYKEKLQAVQIEDGRLRVDLVPEKKNEFYSDLVGYYGNDFFTIEREQFELFFEIKSNPAQARKLAYEALKTFPSYKGDILTSHQDKYLAVSFSSNAQKQKLIEVLSAEKNHSDFVFVAPEQVSVAYLLPSDMYINSQKQTIINQAANSVRNRIDRFGVAEASVSRQSTNRLVVELPGIKDPDQVIKIIKRTGKLEFRLVDDTVSQVRLTEMIKEKKTELKIKNVYHIESINKLNEALKADFPPDTELVFKLVRDPQSKKVVKSIPFLLEKKADVTGDMLDNTSVQTQNNMPYVLMTFNKTGAKKFGTLTTNNIGRLLAIVLDDVVTSSPVIKGPITAGRAQIELGIGPYNELLKEP